MEEEFDINDLLQDKDLQKELYSLGWKEEAIETKASSKNEKSKKNSSIESPDEFLIEEFEPVSIDGIGEVNENDILLNDEDLNDPDLLGMYDDLLAEENDDAPASPVISTPTKPIKPAKPIPTSISSTVPPSAPATVSIPVSAPTPTPAPVPQPEPLPVVYSRNDKVTASEAKRRAVETKKQGDVEEAIFWLRKSKELELKTATTASSTASTSNNHIPTTSSPALTSSNILQGFEILENVITEYINNLISEAKKLKESDPKKAVEKMKEYKKFQQELNVVKARKCIPNAKPTGFSWKSVKISEKYENLTIKDDEIIIKINNINNLKSSLKSYSSKSISLKYSLGLVNSSKDEEVFEKIKKFDYNLDKDIISLEYSKNFSSLKRGKVNNNSNVRKKLTIILTVYRGFFSSATEFAMLVLPLNDFASKCDISGNFPLYSIEKNEDGAIRKGKALGGFVDLSLHIRKPFINDELRVKEERVLVIEPWPLLHDNPEASSSNVQSSTALPSIPPPTSSSSAAAAPSSVSVPSSSSTTIPSTVSTSKPTEDDDIILEVLPLPNPPLSNPLFNDLTDKEKQYPDSIEFIESNDVLDKEISTLQTMLSTMSKDSEDYLTTQIKLQSLEMKSQFLVYQVQNEIISLEDYLEILRNRIKKDKILAVYCKQLNTKSSLAKAINILKRIKIMENELKTAEEGGEEE